MWGAIWKFLTGKIGGKKIENTIIFFIFNQTSGELFDINLQPVYESNKAAILTKAALFGFCSLSDGATI